MLNHGVTRLGELIIIIFFDNFMADARDDLKTSSYYSVFALHFLEKLFKELKMAKSFFFVYCYFFNQHYNANELVPSLFPFAEICLLLVIGGKN